MSEKTPKQLLQEIESATADVDLDTFIEELQPAIKKTLIVRGLTEGATAQEQKVMLDLVGLSKQGREERERKEEVKGTDMPFTKLQTEVERIRLQIQNRQAKKRVEEILEKKTIDVHNLPELFKLIDTAYEYLPTDSDSLVDRKLLQEYTRRYKEEKYRFYVPNHPCENFIRRFADPRIHMGMITAGNGVGKTAMACCILCNIMFENDPIYFGYKLYKDFPFKKKFRIASKEKTIKTEIIPAIKEWFPKGRYEMKKLGKTYESYIETDTGWVGDIMTTDQNVDQYESTTLGLFWGDEEIPLPILDASVYRTRSGGKILLTSTIIDDERSAELAERFTKDKYRFYNNPITGKKEKVENNNFLVEAVTESACAEHGEPNSKGIRGHLKHKDIVNMALSGSREAAEQRLTGKMVNQSNKIFKKFNEKVHVIKPFALPQHNSVMCGFDPHDKKPDGLIWLYIDDKNRYFVVGELLEPFDGTAALAHTIREREKGMRIVDRIADPSAWDTNKHAEEENRSVATKLSREHGIHFRKGTRLRAEADKSIIDAINYTEDNDGNILSPPQLYIFSSCTKTIQQIKNYRWVKKSRNSDEYTHSKKNDDLIEPLGRLLIRKPRHKRLNNVESEQFTDTLIGGTQQTIVPKKRSFAKYL